MVSLDLASVLLALSDQYLQFVQSTTFWLYVIFKGFDLDQLGQLRKNWIYFKMQDMSFDRLLLAVIVAHCQNFWPHHQVALKVSRTLYIKRLLKISC